MIAEFVLVVSVTAPIEHFDRIFNNKKDKDGKDKPNPKDTSPTKK